MTTDQTPLPDKVTFDDGQSRECYVAFCDVLGFSNAVKSNFSAASQVYLDFINKIELLKPISAAEVIVYSDSIVVTSEKLEPVLTTVNLLWWAALLNNWLIRGGVAHGRVWQYEHNGNLFVVSEPLVEAAEIEKTVRMPAVRISPDIAISEDHWMIQFANGALRSPILHFDEINLVNPFNSFWYASAQARVSQLLQHNPDHSEKYNWFLALSERILRTDLPLVPSDVLASLQERGIIKYVPFEPVRGS